MSQSPTPKHDKNGHLVNAKNQIIFDSLCSFCVEDQPAPATSWEEELGEMYRLDYVYLPEIVKFISKVIATERKKAEDLRQARDYILVETALAKGMTIDRFMKAWAKIVSSLPSITNETDL